MAVYDFSGGINALNSGIDSLGASLKTANQQTQSVALAHALAGGDWDGAMQAAAAAGDTNTVLKLRELKQSGDQAAAFGPLADKILGGLGYSGTGAAPGTSPAATGGSFTDQFSRATLGQESGSNPNVRDSPDGAKGIGQIMPATFAQYAKPGEVITNPTDNYNVHQRIVQDYAQRYNNDPRRMAVAYFSGPGNVASPESSTPWIRNSRDGGGQSVAGYVNGIMSRLGSGGGPTGTPSALVGGGGAPGAVYRGADGTTYSGPNAQRDAGAGGTPVSQADVPSPGAVPVSGATPGPLAASLDASVTPPLPPSRPADLGSTADPAVARFLASHVGPQNAAKLLQAPPETPVATLVQPGDVPPDDMAKTAGQLVAEARQALAGGMAHGSPLGSSLGPNIPAQFNMGQAPPPAAPPPGLAPPPAGPVPGLAASDAMGAPVVPPVTPAPVVPPQAPPDPYAGLNPVRASYYRSRGLGPDGRPLPAPVQAGVPASAASAPAVVPPPSAPAPAAAPAAAPADIAAIERTMPAVQQQAASVGGGQVNDAGMAAASALTSGQPVPAGLGASLQAPVMQALSQGGAPAALTQGPLPRAAPGGAPAIAAAPPAAADVPSAGAVPVSLPPPASAAPALASPDNPDPPVTIGGRTWTREQADNDSSASSPSVADVAKAQGITGDIAQDESPKDIADGLKSGEYKYGGAAPPPPIDAKLPPTPAAVKAGDPAVTAAAPVSPQIARSLAQTRPGSDQRMMLFALLMRAAANSGPQSAGNVKFVEGLMAIEKQHQEDFGKTLRTVPDAELASIGYTKAPGSVVQADAWGNLKVTAPGAEPPGHILTPEEVAASPIASVTGPHRVWWQPGKPGAKPEALDAPEEDEKIVAIPPGSDLAIKYPGAVATTVGGKTPGKPIYPPKNIVEPEQEKELAKIRVKPIADAEAQGVTATQQRRTLAIMKDAFQYAESHGGELPQGRLGPTIQALRSYASSVGLDNVFDLSNVAQGDVVEKMNAVLAAASAKSINQRGGTQFEFRTFLQNNPGLSQTVDGRMKLIDILDQDAARAEQMRRIATRTDTTPDNFQQRAEEYDQQHPLISPWSGRPLMTGELVPGYGAPAAAPGAPAPGAPAPGVAPGPGGYVWHPNGSLTPRAP